MKRKIIQTCTVCEGRGPIEEAGGGDDEVAETVARIEQLARERDTCRGLDRSQVDGDDYELLLIWDAHVAHHEREHQRRIAMLCELLAASLGVKKK